MRRMTRQSRTKKVDTAFGTDRLKVARAFLKAARNEVVIAEPGDIGNPVMSLPPRDRVHRALTTTHAGA